MFQNAPAASNLRFAGRRSRKLATGCGARCATTVENSFARAAPCECSLGLLSQPGRVRLGLALFRVRHHAAEAPRRNPVLPRRIAGLPFERPHRRCSSGSTTRGESTCRGRASQREVGGPITQCQEARPDRRARARLGAERRGRATLACESFRRTGPNGRNDSQGLVEAPWVSSYSESAA